MNPRVERLSLLVVVLLAISGATYGILAETPRVDPSLSVVVDGVTDGMRTVDRVGQRVTRLSLAEEKRIGHGIDARIAREARPLDDRDAAYVSEVLAHVVTSAPLQRRGIEYRVRVIDSGEINAYAVPGGHVYVTTSLLAMIESEAELAYVLGHEVAHVDRRHCIEQLQYGVAARRVGGDLASALVDLGASMYRQGFSSELELEADRQGILFAKAAGYHPAAAARLHARWKKILDGEAPPPKGLPGEAAGALRRGLEDYFGSHPSADERIALVATVLREQGLDEASARGYLGGTNFAERRVVDSSRDASEYVVGRLP